MLSRLHVKHLFQRSCPSFFQLRHLCRHHDGPVVSDLKIFCLGAAPNVCLKTVSYRNRLDVFHLTLVTSNEDVTGMLGKKAHFRWPFGRIELRLDAETMPEGHFAQCHSDSAIRNVMRRVD